MQFIRDVIIPIISFNLLRTIKLKDDVLIILSQFFLVLLDMRKIHTSCILMYPDINAFTC